MAKVIQNLPGLLSIKPQYDVDPDTGDKYENILWFLSVTTTTPTVANLQAIAAQFDAQWGPMFGNYGAAGKHYNGCLVTDWSTPFGLFYSSVGTLTPVAGTQGTPVPPNTSILLFMHNGERYRGGHFRVYLPWVGSGAITGAAYDTVSNAVQSILISNMGSVQTNMKGSGVLGGQSWVLYRHRYTSGEARVDQITTYGVRGILATQRRRLRKAPHH
jgi:hypothetical protein